MPLQKDIAAHLQFAKDHVDNPEGYWGNVLKTVESQIYVHSGVECKKLVEREIYAFQDKNLIPTNVMVAASWLGSGSCVWTRMTFIIDRTMNSELYYQILESENSDFQEKVDRATRQ